MGAPLVIVISGPGGVGKGTIVDELVRRDPGLWLSRSWTTRAQRPGESPTSYHFTDRATFEARIAQDGFLEWTEFLGNYYGTPTPDPVDDLDLVLEIEVHGAQQVKTANDDALLIFVLPPTRDEQERRLRRRGDPEHKVAERLRKAEEEEPVGKSMADYVVINDELDRTVAEMLDIVTRERSVRNASR